jgi:hypothetical protein
MSDPDPEPWHVARATAIRLIAFLRDLAWMDPRFDLAEREDLLRSATLIARSIGRPDLEGPDPNEHPMEP